MYKRKSKYKSTIYPPLIIISNHHNNNRMDNSKELTKQICYYLSNENLQSD